MPSSFDVTANVNLNNRSLNASAKKIELALGRITGQASEFQKSLDASIKASSEHSHPSKKHEHDYEHDHYHFHSDIY